MSRIAWLGWLGLLLLTGCGRDAEQLTTVRGKVFYQGRPLIGGTIIFTPDPERGGNGPMSYAEIQADGSYTLRTRQGMGAMPGWHRVTVTEAAPTVAIPGQRHLPPKFSDPEQSGERREVKPGQENEIDFHLE
jgi:hypothetical protein